MQTNASARTPRGVPPQLIPLVQWHTIELSKTETGFYVGVATTLCDDIDGLAVMDRVNERVTTRAEAERLLADVTRLLFAEMR